MPLAVKMYEERQKKTSFVGDLDKPSGILTIIIIWTNVNLRGRIQGHIREQSLNYYPRH